LQLGINSWIADFYTPDSYRLPQYVGEVVFVKSKIIGLHYVGDSAPGATQTSHHKYRRLKIYGYKQGIKD
jgi:hypothetical protein